LPPSGTELRRAFEALVATLDEQHVRYAIVGGLAVLQHTRVRTTDDVDALLDLPQIAMSPFFEALRARGFQLDVQSTIRQFRDEGLTTVRLGDVLVDLMRPVIPAYAHVVDRAIIARFYDRDVRVSAAEGLIVMKLAGMRPQDEADIQDLLAAYGGKLDLDYVRRELSTFTAADDPRVAKFEAWVKATPPA
jgi:hypothetical protein